MSGSLCQLVRELERFLQCVCVCVSANPHQGGNKLRNAVKAYLLKHYLIGVLSHRTRLGCEWYSVLSLSLTTHCFLPIISSLAPLPPSYCSRFIHINCLSFSTDDTYSYLARNLIIGEALPSQVFQVVLKVIKAQQPKLAPRSKWFVYTIAGHHQPLPTWLTTVWVCNMHCPFDRVASIVLPSMSHKSRLLKLLVMSCHNRS